MILSAAITLAGAVLVSLSGRATATTIYYDTNGVTAGTGTGAIDWNSGNAVWNTDPTGVAAPVAWPASGAGNLDGDDVVFSAGTNAPVSYTINPAGVKIANSITVNESGITLKVLGGSAAGRTILGGGITLSNSTAGLSPVTGFTWSLGTAGLATLTLGANQNWTINDPTAGITIGVAVNGNATLGNTNTLTGVANGSGQILLSNTISDGTTGGKVGIAESIGKMTLSGNNSYSGGTSVSGGLLVLDNGGILQHGNVSITGGDFAAGVTGAGGTLDDTVANDLSDLVAISGSGTLDLTNMKLVVTASGTQTQTEYVLANKAVGSSNVIGTSFLSAALPSGWSINYNGTTANPNSIVLVVGAATPEPASLGVIGVGAVALLRRRKR